MARNLNLQISQLLIASVLFTGCEGNQIQLSLRQSSEIRGSAEMFSSQGSGSLAAQSACSGARVSLHALDSTGLPLPTELSSSEVSSDGSFKLKGQTVPELKTSSSSISYVLKASGCGLEYFRPLTQRTGQIISGSSTLIVLASQENTARKLTSMTALEVEEALSALKSVDQPDLTRLLNEITDNTTLSQIFSTVTSTTPAQMKEQAPSSWNLVAPENLSENAVTRYQVENIYHWNEEYQSAVQWILDGQVVSNSKTWDFETNKNSQGQRSLRVLIGAAAANQTLDSTKPYREKTVSLTIANTSPAVAPGLTLVGPQILNGLSGSLQIQTGAALSNCESFTSLALTESAFSPPVSSSAYSISCSQEVVQSQAFTLSSGDGIKTLALWAKDASGLISSTPSTVTLTLDQTPPVLTISPPSLVKGGSDVNIPLTALDATSGLDNLKIQFSPDGSSYVDIADLPITASSYTWSAPGLDTSTAKLRLVATDRAGNSAQIDSASFSIDSTAPSVSINGPAALTETQATLTLTGTCESGLPVSLTGGASTLTTPCNAGSFSQSLSLSGADGIKNISASQTDAAGNTSSSNRNFVRDTTAPVLSFTGPAAATAARNGVLIVGHCEEGLTITIEGTGVASPATTSCTNESFSYPLLFSAGDGSKLVSLRQTDSAGNTGTTQRTFTRDSQAPSLSISGPPEGASVKTSFTLSGICDAAGGAISVSGSNLSSSPVSISCSGGNFSQALSFTGADGNRSLSISQTDAALVTTNITLNLIKDSLAPSISIVSPASGTPFRTNLTLTGTCETGLDVEYSGTGVATSGSVACVAGNFSAGIELTANEGTKNLIVSQIDTAGNSATANLQVLRDNTPPTVTVASPAQSAVVPASMTLSGSCENGGSNLTISSPDLNGSPVSVACTAGSYTTGSLTLNSPDGNKTLTVSQNDSAGNTGSINRSLVRDGTPPVLTKSAPADSSSWQDVFTVSGTCENTRTINLTGTGLASATSSVCNAGSYSMAASLSAGEGTKNLLLRETDGVGNISEISFSLVRDNTAPVLTQTQRASTSYSNTDSVTFGGACESGVAVAISGAYTGTVTCNAGVWSYATNKSIDGSYNYNFTQTDSAGNSTTLTATWIRDKVQPNIVISGPAANTSVQQGLTITGTCESGLNVDISGSGIVGSISVACPSGSFSQYIYLSSGDGTKSVSVAQTDLAGNTKTVSRNFALDTTAPSLTQTTQASPYSNNATTATFGGTCETGITVNVGGTDSASTTCTSGTWSYTTATKNTDGSRNYTFTQTDPAGNQAQVSATWIRDSIAPVLSFNSSSSFLTSGNSVSFYGSCETGLPIQVSGAASATLSCPSGTWSYSASKTADAIYTYSFQQTDLGGNTTTLTGTWQRSTTGPTISISQNNPQITSDGSLVISGSCSGGSAGSTGTITISGSSSGTTTCSSTDTTVGTWSYTAVKATDGSYNYDFSITDQFTTPRTSSASLNWVRDTTAPQISASSFSINGGTSTTTALSYNPVSFQATDNLSFVSKFCLKNESSTPDTDASCWTSLSESGINVTPSNAVSVSNYSHNIGILPQSYSFYLWVMDRAGNISSNTSVLGTDQVNITLAPLAPPSVSNLAVSRYDTMNGDLAERTIPGGSDVYIRWTASGSNLITNPISLAFTVDDTNWTSIASGLANGLNNCSSVTGSGSLSASSTGCYKWSSGSPSSAYYRIRVSMTNALGATTYANSLPINSSNLQIIAGNTNSGIGGAATSGIFVADYSGSAYGDNFSLVVNSKGVIYFRDINLGIVSVDPADGKMKLLIPKGATTSGVGDGGSIENAKLRVPSAIGIDGKDRLIILDYDRIRRVDFSSSPATINTIVGGGTDTSDTVAVAKNLKFSSNYNWYAVGSSNRVSLAVLPNGNIYFYSETPSVTSAEKRIRVYSDRTQSVTSIRASGSGTLSSGITYADFYKCIQPNFFVKFDPSTSEVQDIFIQILPSSTTPGCTTTAIVDANITFREFIRLDPTTGAYDPSRSFPTISKYFYLFAPTLSLDGNVYYSENYTGTVRKLNLNTGVWDIVVGTGTVGQCADDTPALSCKIDNGGSFIDRKGQVYFVDRGRIRTVLNNVTKTLVGQSLDYGEDGIATEARFGQIQGVLQRPSDSQIILLDSMNNKLQMFPRGGNLTRIAGNGVVGLASTSAFAPSSQIPVTFNFVLDANENIILSNTSLLVSLPNTYATSPSSTKFIAVKNNSNQNIFSGSTDYFNSAANGVDFSSVTGSGIRMQPVAWTNDRILLGITQKIGNAYYNYMFSEIDLANKTYRHVSNPVTSGSSFCADGISVASCTTSRTPTNDFLMGDYDEVSQNWIIPDSNMQNLRTVSPGLVGNYGTLTSTAKTINTFVFRRFPSTNNHRYIYYCAKTDGRIYLRDADANNGAGSEKALPWPITSLKCTGSQMVYDPQRNSLIFAFTQNGFYGVAEMLNVDPAQNGM